MAAGCAELGAPCWMTVDQDRINEFAERADNRQGMRVELERAKERASEVAEPLSSRAGASERESTQPARFAVGDRVRMKTIKPPTHTRLPHYVRGHVGVIELLHGTHVFPDSYAIGKGEGPQWLYTVKFDSRELWRKDDDANVTISVDAWDSYLEPA